MNDLYKQLGVGESSGEAEIRAALGGAAPDLREAAEFILLDPARRAVYDRNRRVLVTVGRLRANLGLNLTRFWPRSRFADFTTDLNPLPRGGGVAGRPNDPMRMAWAFGVAPPEGNESRQRRRRTLITIMVLVFAGAVIVALWSWKWRVW